MAWRKDEEAEIGTAFGLDTYGEDVLGCERSISLTKDMDALEEYGIDQLVVLALRLAIEVSIPSQDMERSLLDAAGASGAEEAWPTNSTSRSFR